MVVTFVFEYTSVSVEKVAPLLQCVNVVPDKEPAAPLPFDNVHPVNSYPALVGAETVVFSLHSFVASV